MPSWLETTADRIYRSEYGRLEPREEYPQDDAGKHFVLLDSQAILSIEGDNAANFLQGQCTADMSKLSEGQSTLGAFCNNKGRVLANFRALRTENSILLRMSADIAQDTLDHLVKYAVFFKVDMQVWRAPAVAAAIDAADMPLHELPEGIHAAVVEDDSVEFYIQPGCADSFLDYLNGKVRFESESDWCARQISFGITSINKNTVEKYLPHELNMDKSGAVNFKKGCYTGQEIVARTEYRGQTKWRVFPVFVDAELSADTELRIAAVDAPEKTFDVLDLATWDQKLITALLLPVEFPESGYLMVNGEKKVYQMIPLPYSID